MVETKPLKHSGLPCWKSEGMPSDIKLVSPCCSAGESDLFVARRVLEDGSSWMNDGDILFEVVYDGIHVVLQLVGFVLAAKWLDGLDTLRDVVK